MRFSLRKAVMGVVLSFLLSGFTTALAEEQRVQNGSATGSIRVAVQDEGLMAVWRFDASYVDCTVNTDFPDGWVEQTYGPFSKHSVLFLAGNDTAMRFSSGRWTPLWNPVSNTKSADNTTITTVFLTPDNNVRVTQITSVTSGPYYRMSWSIENIGAATYDDVRFAHGEDTYLAGDDNGEGHFDNALKMVYVMNPGVTADLMGLYSSASTPFSFYFEGPYSTNYARMGNWTQDNTVDPTNVDCGYSLGWTRASLAPGATWTIVAYEKFTQAVGVQVIAPAEQGGNPGDTLTYAFTVRNLDSTPPPASPAAGGIRPLATSSMDIALGSSSANGWTTSVVDGSGDPLPSVTLAGGAETVVYVRLAIPAGAASGATDLLTLTATFGAEETSSDSTTTVVAGTAPPPAPSPNLTFQNGGMGGGWIGSCGMVVGRDGKGPLSAREGAGMIALYFALLLLPVGILKLVHRRKRLPLEKAGIVALFLVASMLAASSAHAVRLIAPKAQRFHPTTDGLGALTVDTDQTLCPGRFNVGLTLSGAKKPLDMGNIRDLSIEKVVVDELYAADLTVGYGLTPDITLGLDIPYQYSRDNLNYTEFLKGNTGVRDDVSHVGDIRLNAKFRVLERPRYGLALIPFANFATGNRDFLLSEGKFGFGVKAAGHFDVAKPLTLYANLGAEHVGDIAAAPSSDRYYTPWIQYGVGAKYLLPWRKDHIVAEVNGETAWATPFAHSTLSPLEVLAAYRSEVAPGITLQAGGGGGLNKGMGAPQWRAILGIAFNM